MSRISQSRRFLAVTGGCLNQESTSCLSLLHRVHIQGQFSDSTAFRCFSISPRSSCSKTKDEAAEVDRPPPLKIKDLLSYDFTQFTINVSKMANKGLPIMHHHDYVSDLPPNHRFAMGKFHGVFKYLRQDQVISRKQVYVPVEVTAETAGLAHDKDYVIKFFNGLTSDKEQRKTGFNWNEGLLKRCRLETGGTLLGAQLAIERGLASSTGGGTHHAFADHGSGYCLINDMAITAKFALAAEMAERVLIIDLDVHQDKQYLTILDDHLQSLLNSFRPDLVIYDAGVDPHADDELGKLNLTDQGLFDRDYYVLEECVKRGIPCVTVIGGGYSRDLEALSLRHTIVHRAATKIWHSWML